MAWTIKILKAPKQVPKGLKPLWYLGLSILGLTLFLLLILQLAPVRSVGLQLVADKIGQGLPGEISVDTAWPKLGRIELNQLLWVTDSDTLITSGKIALDLHLRGLLRRDLVINEIVANDLQVDLPALRRITTSLVDPGLATNPEKAQRDKNTEIPILRQGSLYPLPSFQLSSFRLTATDIKLNPEQSIRDIDMALSCEFRSDKIASLSLDRMLISTKPETWKVAACQFHWAQNGRSLTGAASGMATPNRSFRFTSQPAGADACSLSIISGLDEEEPDINLAGQVKLTGWREPDFSLTMTGDLLGEAVHLIEVTIDASDGFDHSINSALRIAARDLDLATRIEASRGEETEIRMSPLEILLAPGAVLTERTEQKLTGKVVIGSEASDSVVANDLAISGALGDLTFSGALDQDKAWADLAIHWPQAPEYLIHQLSVREGWLADSLKSRWAKVQPLKFQLRSEATRDSTTGAFVTGLIDGSFSLPGPSQLKSLLPLELEVDDLGEVVGLFSIQADGLDSDSLSFDFGLDMSPTKWLDDCRILASRIGQAVVLDTMALAMEGLTLAAEGQFDSDLVDLSISCEMPSGALLQRYRGLVADPDRFALNLVAAATGPISQPDIIAELTLSGEIGAVEVPQLAAAIEVSAGKLNATCDLPMGLSTHEIEMNRIHLKSNGDLRADSTRLSFDAELEGELLDLALAGELTGPDTLTVEIDVFSLAVLGGDLSAKSPLFISYCPSTTDLMTLQLALSGSLGEFSATGRATDDSLALDAHLDATIAVNALRDFLPLASLPSNTDLDLHAAGDLNFSGTGNEPNMTFEGLGELIDPVRKQRFGAMVNLLLGSPRSSFPGLKSNFSLFLGDSTLIDGKAHYPAIVTLVPAVIAPVESDSGSIRIKSREIDLDQINQFLPAGISLEGQLKLSAAATSLNETIDLAGEINLSQVLAHLDNGSWVSTTGDVQVMGTSAAPQIRGTIELSGGVINLPPVPPILMPRSGEAMLWEIDSVQALPLVTETDSSNSPGADLAAPRTADSDSLGTGQPNINMTVDLTCPGNFWLRGQGLEIELAGDLEITQTDLLPTILGDLEAVRGTFKFLGRSFSIDRGAIVFYGDLKNDPEFDLQLSANFDGTDYRIVVSGPALRPKLVLESNPLMSEGDILASLLFGKPIDQLDSGQEELLIQRSTQILAAYSATTLQDQLAGRFGVDMITFDQATDSDDVSSLIIGKYLNPNVLLRYEQVLDSESAFFVHLDYTLSRAFKVQTSVSQGAASGVEVKWSKNY